MESKKTATSDLLSQVEQLVLDRENALDVAASEASTELGDATERLKKLQFNHLISTSMTEWIGTEDDSFPVENVLFFDHKTGKLMFTMDNGEPEYVLGMKRQHRIEIARKYLPNLLSELIHDLVTEIETI